MSAKGKKAKTEAELEEYLSADMGRFVESEVIRKQLDLLIDQAKQRGVSEASKARIEEIKKEFLPNVSSACYRVFRGYAKRIG